MEKEVVKEHVRHCYFRFLVTAVFLCQFCIYSKQSYVSLVFMTDFVICCLSLLIYLSHPPSPMSGLGTTYGNDIKKILLLTLSLIWPASKSWLRIVYWPCLYHHLVIDVPCFILKELIKIKWDC